MIRTYSELIRLPSFEERFEYAKLGGIVGKSTFGFGRIFNQQFYHSPEYRRVKRDLILRDNGCDLGHPDHPIVGPITLHHLIPMTLQDLEEGNPLILDPENLICVSHDTHNAIHYGDARLLPKPPIERRPNDTCPWRR